MNTLTIAQLAQVIADNAKTGKWLSCHFQVTHDRGTFGVGVKAFGKWVQRLECCGLCDGVPEQRTIKALKAETEKTLAQLLACA